MTFLVLSFFVLLLLGAAFLTVLGLPGNWLIILFTVLITLFTPVSYGIFISYWIIGAMVLLAGIGEGLEFLLGAASVAKGGSKKGALWALLGSILGSILGASVLSIIPLLGTAVGLVLGAALGAMGGAFFAEKSLGKDTEESLRLGKVAFWGRLLGSVAKIMIAGVLVSIAILAVLF